jgi:hypothetical protein
MGFKDLVGRIKSMPNFKGAAVAAGVLAIAAAGGAYYFLVYEPQEQSKTPAAAAPPAGRKPQPGPSQPAARPAMAKPVAPVSGVPAVASDKQKPVVAQVPGAPAPAPELIAKPAMPDLEAEQPKMPKAKPAPTLAAPEAARPEQAAKRESKLDAQDMRREVSPQPLEVLPEAASRSEGVETATVAPVEPAPRPNAITPKYNDVMTAVLRGDKEAVRELLDLGWWVDKPSANGITPLMAAVMNQDAPMVQLLLDHGAEPSVQALNLARKNKDAASASLLEQKGAR